MRSETASGRNPGRRVQAAAALLLGIAATSCAPALSGSGAAREYPRTWVEPRTGMEFVLVSGGEFLMGSDGYRADESPPHRVKVGSFYLARHEVTQSAWKKIMNGNPSRFADCSECPVEQVSWRDAGEFLLRLSNRAGTSFRLPTEAEWEYAAGGGAVHQEWPGTHSKSETGEFSWYSGNFSGKTRSVGKKIENLFGLYDMGGNVAEWCSDWYGRDYYRHSPVDNPKGPATGTRRVVRGGSWLSGPEDVRTARRAGRSPDTRSPAVGFRPARGVRD